MLKNVTDDTPPPYGTEAKDIRYIYKPILPKVIRFEISIEVDREYTEEQVQEIFDKIINGK